MYAPGPSDEELAAIGITREDIVDDSITEIWPENEIPLEVFQRLGTQWVVGSGGPVGLNYNSIPVVIEMMGVKKKNREDVFEALRIMESAALSQMSSKG